MRDNPDKKDYISPKRLFTASNYLAQLIVESRFNPTVVLGIWRGGAPIAITIHEYLLYKKINARSLVIATSSYEGFTRGDRVKLEYEKEVFNSLARGDRLLIVDDVFDSGSSLYAILRTLTSYSNCPESIKTAVIWYKSEQSVVAMRPDYYVHNTDQWLVFPHELQGLNNNDLRAKSRAVGINYLCDLPVTQSDPTE